MTVSYRNSVISFCKINVIVLRKITHEKKKTKNTKIMIINNKETCYRFLEVFALKS